MADPIHGNIRLDRHDETHRLMLDVINSQPFQRLRRIKQMGMAEFVFPGATHSRFVHSLGATHLMMNAIQHFNTTERTRKLLASSYGKSGISLSRLLLLTILIHDIGHTPLSHTLEDILHLRENGLLHDDYWNRKILTENEALQAIWKKYDPALPEAMLNFMGDGAPKHFLAYLVSSQLDMDRLDYLQRDSHYLGVQYGRIEADRIIVNMEIETLTDGSPVVALREEAIPAIEHYLFGRHQAYKMALHSLDKASEALLKKTLERFRWVYENTRASEMTPENPAYKLFLLAQGGKALTTEQFLRMDDCYLWELINTWANEARDPLLRELSCRLLQHEIFKFVDLSKYGCNGPLESVPEVYNALRDHYEARGLCFDFGYDETRVKSKPLYLPPPIREPIWIRTAQGVVDLREVSSLPLVSDPGRGEKYLLFVWDGEARRFLTETLNRHFGGGE
jgi:HD superfamily phosphohydrolase